MERRNRDNNIVLLFDLYLADSQNLYNSFLKSDIDMEAVVINDDGFLPEGVNSVYEYFLGGFDESKKPLFFNQINIPEYWRITANNSYGEIFNLNKKRGQIFYASPSHLRLVRAVEWLDDNGKVRFCDYYNRYGALYARATFDREGKAIIKSYMNDKGQEIITENYITGDVILNYKNKVMIFQSKAELVVYYLEERRLTKSRLFVNSLGTPFFVSQRLKDNNKSDVLFWQEPERDDVPGNMEYILQGRATRMDKIYVQRHASYESFINQGVSPDKVTELGYVYPYVRDTNYNMEALICTNSDNIDKLEEIVDRLSNVHFHIAALTEMSAKLMAYGKKDNVTLYPAAKTATFDKLFDRCDIYLDINREREIVSAVNTAFLNNQIIFAFRETIHNKNYIASEHIYNAEDVELLIDKIEDITANKQMWDEELHLQRQHALSEDSIQYRKLI